MRPHEVRRILLGDYHERDPEARGHMIIRGALRGAPQRRPVDFQGREAVVRRGLESRLPLPELGAVRTRSLASYGVKNRARHDPRDCSEICD